MQVPRGLFLVTCTGTRAWTPASGPRTLLSAKGGNIRVPPSISNPFLPAKQSSQGHGDRRPHPVTGTSNKECCEQSRPCSCYKPHSSALSLAQHPSSAGPSGTQARPPVFLWPLSPPSAAEPGRPPTPSASQPLSLQVSALGSTSCWHAANLCSHLGILSCRVFSLHVCGAVLCLVSPSAAPSPAVCSYSRCLWLAGHTGFGRRPHKCCEASDPHGHTLLGLEAQLALSV